MLFLVLCTNSLVFAQNLTDQQLKHILDTGTEIEIVQLNTQLILNKNFYQASITADKLLTFNGDSPNYNYRKGFAILKTSDNFLKSKSYLKIAVTSINKNFDMMSHKEKSAPIDALFYMGKAYHLSGELDQAIEYYERFITTIDAKNELINMAKVHITQCNVAKEIVNNPVDFEVINVGEKINTTNPEYSPVVSLDGAALYFTSRRLYPDSININIKEPGTNLFLEDVYVAYKDNNNEWGDPVIMDFCKPEFNEATVAVSTDERRIYVYMDETGNGDIYYSNFESSQFQDLKFLEDKDVNTDAWETHITVSPDGKKKYFASDRKGGYGGRDIYMIEKNQDGSWSNPANLGPKINTSHDEDAPFIATDNRTMYFAHNGPKSIGGFDIFKTEINQTGLWSTPENLGYPLNSTSDDIYYTTTVDGLTGYLTSFRAGGFGDKDIYEIKNKHLGVDNIAVLMGEIETIDGTPLPEDIAFTVKCLDCDEPYKFTLFPRISDGTFFASLYTCQEYEVTFHHKNGQEIISREIIKTNCDNAYEEIFRRLVLDVPEMTLFNPRDLIDSYEPLAMKHFFGYNKNTLDPEKGALKAFMDSLNAQLQNGRTAIEIEINASASTVPTRTYSNNEVLVEKRAKGVEQFLLNYFAEKGIADSIKLTVNKVEITGPKYNGDFDNPEKYIPYQYVELTLNGVNSVNNESTLMSSTDGNIVQVEIVEQKHQFKDEQGDVFTSGDLNSNEYDFHVVIGVFKRIHYAEGMVNSAIKKGYDAQIIGKRNDMHVVSAAHANSKEEASEILKRIRKEVVQSAWILNIKK
jgi:tetratricopeptide (TPR) repeat protein/cell division septation protein DedD